jgi:glyoxylase I family protein
MSQARLEHVNITVSDNDRSARLLADITGWAIRWRGASSQGGETIHLGNEYAYLALYQDGADHSGHAKGLPLNHVGLLVDDLAAARRSVLAHGLEPFGYGDYAPGQRFYFFDWDGIEFEVVSYA